MIGRILFLSAAAYLAYRYIGKSNRKVRELAQKEGMVEILPPQSRAAVGSAREALPGPKTIERESTAVERFNR